MQELLKKLCAEAGVSGNEEAVAECIKNEIKPYADLSTDGLGSLIAFKKGKNRPKEKLMVCAHMDEVGLMLTGCDEKGFLKFGTVGGIDPRVLPATRVKIGPNKIPGVIGVKTLHLQTPDEDGVAPGADKLYIDIGAVSKEDALSKVSLGDVAVFDSRFLSFGDGMVKARAIDDRVGCAVMIKMIQSELEYDTTFAFTVQEEVGARGGKTAAFTVDPDCAIVLEATTAADIPFMEKDKQVCRLGGGPVVSFIDKGTLYDRKLYETAFRLAKENGIPCQPKLAIAGGNDASSVHVSRGGVRTIAVSLPCRYLHSPSCVIKVSDAEATLALVRLLSEAIAGGNA